MEFWEDEKNRDGLKKARCVIVDTKGSTPRRVGAKMIVFQNGRINGTIGGGNLEKKVIENAITQIEKGEPKLFKHDLLHQHNMCCGGTVFIYIEPIMEAKNLFIFGAGHTGAALANMASKLDFNVYLIDDRSEYIESTNKENVNTLNIDYKEALPSLPFNENSYIAIMTYEHAHDRDILSYCLGKPHAYLGMIGSQRKIELTKKLLIEGDFGKQEEIDKIDMPMGISINAEGPEEIAISILAKLIQVKNDN